MSSPVSSITFTTQGALRKSALRHANQRLVLNAIRQNPALSRLDISRMTGLSASSVTFIVKRLAKEKLIREDKVEPAPPAGRPPMNLQLEESARYAVGVDISPTGSSIAVASWTGRLLQRLPVKNAEPGVFLADVRRRLEELTMQFGRARVLGAGVSVAGTVDPAAGILSEGPNLGWRNVALADLLRGIGVPVYFDNNANLSALGERWFRKTEEPALDNFVFVTLGGGIGTGVIAGGQLLHGAHGRAGEFGHTTLFPDGRKCLCGNLGCWEEYASDRALTRLYGDTGVDALQVVDLAKSGDAKALTAVREAGHHLALGFVNLINGLDPEAIVFDNWGAAAWRLIEKNVWTVIEQRIPKAWRQGIRIAPSAHASEASLRGAVALALTGYFHSFSHHSGEDEESQVSMRH